MTRKRTERFPLWLHPSGQWCKKHRGQFFYFGLDKEEAHNRYLKEWPDIKEGRTPRKTDSIDVGTLANLFLAAKRSLVDSGELSGVMWSEYHRACEIVVDTFGKLRPVEDLRSDDFGKLRGVLAKRFSAASLGKYITLTRTLFKWGFDSEHLTTPVRYGNAFEKPPRRVLRLEKAQRALRMLDPADIRRMIDAADVQIKAMILLGCNAAFGAKDCADLQRQSLELRRGWVDFPRPKTGIARRCPLWPETIAALDAVDTERPKPTSPDDAGCVFITGRGNRWVRFRDRGDKPGVNLDAVSNEFRKLAKRLRIELVGGFYTLRHVFQTIADGTKDRTAVGIIMGHHDDSQSAYYRELVEDSRLEAVTNHVWKWLFGANEKT